MPKLGPGPFHTASDKPLFGAIGDSAPDRWGRVLMRRAERRRAERARETPRTLWEFDYLLMVDDEARPGALRFADREGGQFLAAATATIPPLIELPRLLSAADHVADDSDSDEDLRLLLAPGSSLGGARPKASVRDRDGQLAVAKFPHKGDEINAFRWEAVALSLAAKAGIPVPAWKISRLERGTVHKRTMHLAQFLCHSPTYHSLAMWRHPRTAGAGFDWARPELYQHIARVCERGKFDMVFFADLNYISDTYRGTMDPAIRYATQAPEHDPIPLLSFMAAVTTHIGLGATFSISHAHPFYAARLWATLDHLTRGRAAWNVVTSLNHNQSANYGEDLRPTDERYDRAHEFIEVCRKLWASWEPDAVVMDRAAGVFADPAKVHRVEHEGRFFRSRGPLNVVRSPQGGPAILQAGTSPKGRTFAARYADAIFAIQPNIAGARAYYDDIKSGTVNEGRAPEACKILFGIQPILGATEEEAREKQALHNRLVPLEGGLAILSGHLDFDLSALPLDEVMARRTEPQLQRMQTRYRTLTGELLTLRDVAQRHGQSVGLVQMVGTPSQVADQMEDYFDQVGGDGFMLSPIYSPGAIEEFVDLVVPELQRRGRYRRAYAGSTQRDHLMQED